MKKGQNTTHEKNYFQAGIGGKISSQDLNNIVSGWGGGNKIHLAAKNIARKKKKRKK